MPIIEVTHVVDSSGALRRMGNLRPDAGRVRYSWPVYGSVDTAPLVPRDRWAELIREQGGADSGPAALEHPCLPYVHDQGQVGQCNADATAALAEFCRAQAGLPFEALSAADLYDRINGGADNGSLLEDAVREMLQRGIGTAKTCGTLWRPGMRQATAEERNNYKALEVFLCPTFDHVMSAVLSGFGVVSGVMWYDGYEPDADGWLPERAPGGAGGGHAVFGYRAVMRGGKYGVAHQNSWTARWGLGGRCVFNEMTYRGPVGGWWAMRAVTSTPDGAPVPAPLAG